MGACIGHIGGAEGHIGGAFVHSYHWLPLATTGLVGDNREFEV